MMNKQIEDLAKDIFMENLRFYNDGINKTHAAEPQTTVTRELTKQSYFMALEFFRTIEELERS